MKQRERKYASRAVATVVTTLALLSLVFLSTRYSSHRSVHAAAGGASVGKSSASILLAAVEQKASSQISSQAVPRADQFYYIKGVFHGQTGEIWFSMDGTHDGKMIRPDLTDQPIPLPGCRGGEQAVVRGSQLTGGQQPCTPQPAYLPDLPTNASDMAAYLAKGIGPKTDRTNYIAKSATTLLELDYISDAARSAVYGALKDLPGLSVVSSAKDGSGRTGTGIVWSTQASSNAQQVTLAGSIVLDPNTYSYMGQINEDAIISSAVVDSAGQVG